MTSPTQPDHRARTVDTAPTSTPERTMKRGSGLLVATAVLVAVLGVGGLYGGVLGELRSGGGAATAASRPALDADPLALPLAGGTAATVARLEREVRSDPRDADRLGELGLAYQLRWRETGDPSFLPLSERGAPGCGRSTPARCGRDARARQPRPHPPRFPPRARARSRRPTPCAVRRAPLWRRRRCADRARPLRRGVRDVRAHDGREAEPRLVRARRLCAGADR